MYRKRSDSLYAPALAALGALTLGAAHAEQYGAETRATADADRPAGDLADEMRDAKRQVHEATAVVEQMKLDAKLTELLQRAHGVFVAPDFGKGAAIVGARGGEGVLLVRDGDEWSSPAFYNFGGMSVGAQVGGAGGSFAMLLMNEQAVNHFRNNNNFSVDASAGLNVMEYGAGAQASAGKGDVIVWTSSRGLFAGASIGVSGVVRDEDENRAYYQQQASVDQVLSGAVRNPDAQMLRDALPERMAASQ